MLKQSGCLNDEEAFIAALYEREEIGSTYMGEGIVIPHGKSETVNHAATAICRCSPLLKLDNCYRYRPSGRELIRNNLEFSAFAGA